MKAIVKELSIARILPRSSILFLENPGSALEVGKARYDVFTSLPADASMAGIRLRREGITVNMGGINLNFKLELLTFK